MNKASAGTWRESQFVFPGLLTTSTKESLIGGVVLNNLFSGNSCGSVWWKL
jgi:hypothetical protein